MIWIVDALRERSKNKNTTNSSPMVPKPDRYFDTLKDVRSGMRSSNRGFSRGKGDIFSALMIEFSYEYYKRSIIKRGQYFHYTSLTARVARSGKVGHEAYVYSLSDPNANPRPLSSDELKRLNLIERFAYRYRPVFFWGFLPVPFYYAYFMMDQYTKYENLWPVVALPVVVIVILYWLQLVSVADGCSIKVLPDDIIAFSRTDNR